MFLLTLGAVLGVRAFRKPAESEAATAPTGPLSGEQVYRRLIRTAALIEAGNSSGSGFLIDADKRFVMTNFHVVGNERTVMVFFPLLDEKGQPVTDAGEYRRRTGELAIRGDVIARDVSRDLALVRLERLPENVSAAALSRDSAPTGGVVYSVGGSGASDNLLWRLTKGTVRGRAQRRSDADFGTVDCMILETDAPVNSGDSGGPVMNERGELVGVVSHFNTRARQVSGNIDVDEVRKFMARHAPGGGSSPTTPAAGSVSNNKGKIEGRWKILVLPSKSDRDLVAEMAAQGIYLQLEYKINGVLTLGLAADKPAALEQLRAVRAKGQPLNWNMKYRLLADDEVELYELPKDMQDDGLFGKKDRRTVKIWIAGDQMRMIDDDGTTTLTRMR